MWPFSRPALTFAQKLVIVGTEGALLGAYAASAAVTYVATTKTAEMAVEVTAKGLELSANLATNLANKARSAIKKTDSKPEIAPVCEAPDPKGPDSGGVEQPAA